MRKNSHTSFAMNNESHPLSPSEWGNHCWRFLHSSSFAWPATASSAQRASAKAFYQNLGNMLPCPICKQHYNEHVKHNPPKVGSRDELSRWLVDIHNAVNQSQNKPTVDYDTVRRHYTENTRELQCETAYVKHLQGKLQRRDAALWSLTISIVILAIILARRSIRGQ